MEETPKLAQNQNQFDRRVYLGLIVFACFVTFMSCPFSPIYRYIFETDEICYHTISLGWLRGRIPYRDLFDHKGPLTYVIYALGLLLSGRHTIGILLIFMAINAVSFVMMYRILRLFFDKDRALGGTVLVLILFFVKSRSLFSSGSKPDHFILLILLLSEYLYVRGIKRYHSNGSTSPSATKSDEDKPDRPPYHVAFTTLEMLLLGLSCGAVFMIKLNVCIYYLTFIGFYLLWLLTRKYWKSFFCSCGLFLLGIVTVCAPFFIYYSSQHALSDFIYAYFKFNTVYAKKGGIHLLFSRPFVDVQNSLVIVLLFAFLILTAYAFLNAKENRMTRVILVICSAITYAILAFAEVFPYTFVLLIPLYIWACVLLVDLLYAFINQKTTRIAMVILAVFITVNYTMNRVILDPSIPHEAPPVEQAMDTYFEAHPDSTTIYYYNLCFPFCYSKTYATPDFKYFFIPREASFEMYAEQTNYIRSAQPDVIAFWDPQDLDEEAIQDLFSFFEQSGYTFYVTEDEDALYDIFVRTSTLP